MGMSLAYDWQIMGVLMNIIGLRFVQPIAEAISKASSGRVSIRGGVELCPSRAEMHGVSRGANGAAVDDFG